MSADQVFQISNFAALTGWLVLIAGVVLRNNFLRDHLAGLWWPLAFSGLYTVLILFFFASTPGGFDSLANVKLLFTSDWVALAGWVHYLAFDLFVGAWIARELMARGWPRLLLVPLLPLTFLFGPIGLLAWQVCRVVLSKTAPAKA